MNIRVFCPECETAGRLTVPGAGEWQCPRCDHIVRLPEGKTDPSLSACLVCGNHELYKKKDFPHGLGMTILVLSCVAATVTYALHQFWTTWAILIGSALFDGLLYLWVKDVIVCYRCGAEHRGITARPAHAPFELTIHERYRQERLRQEEMQKQGR